MPSFGEDDLEKSEKFCPVCKNKNEGKALVCAFCGAPLDENVVGATVTAITAEGPASGLATDPRSLVDGELIPVDGIAVYAAGADKPVYVRVASEMVFGRKVNDVAESLLDLTSLGGFQMGISRRHAMIRRAGTGYEILDLSSTNGTWLNNERLVPNKPYPLASGSQVRLGRMRLFLFYRTLSEGKKT